MVSQIEKRKIDHIKLCVEKDVALCQIEKVDDRKLIQGDKKPEEINMKFVVIKLNIEIKTTDGMNWINIKLKKAVFKSRVVNTN